MTTSRPGMAKPSPRPRPVPSLDEFPSIEHRPVPFPALWRRLVPYAVALAVGLPALAGPPIAYIVWAPVPPLPFAVAAAAAPVTLAPLFLLALTRWSDHRVR